MKQTDRKRKNKTQFKLHLSLRSSYEPEATKATWGIENRRNRTKKKSRKKKLKGRRTHRVWELDRIRAESTDTQAQIGNVNELSRKRNEKTEFVGRERERERREKSLETENSDLRRSHMREGKDSKEEKGRRRNQRNK